jgi:uncharacterized membrane protein
MTNSNNNNNRITLFVLIVVFLFLCYTHAAINQPHTNNNAMMEEEFRTSIKQTEQDTPRISASITSPIPSDSNQTHYTPSDRTLSNVEFVFLFIVIGLIAAPTVIALFVTILACCMKKTRYAAKSIQNRLHNSLSYRSMRNSVTSDLSSEIKRQSAQEKWFNEEHVSAL